jgi:hypothetical protein
MHKTTARITLRNQYSSYVSKCCASILSIIVRTGIQEYINEYGYDLTGMYILIDLCVIVKSFITLVKMCMVLILT